MNRGYIQRFRSTASSLFIFRACLFMHYLLDKRNSSSSKSFFPFSFIYQMFDLWYSRNRYQYHDGRPYFLDEIVHLLNKSICDARFLWLRVCKVASVLYLPHYRRSEKAFLVLVDGAGATAAIVSVGPQKGPHVFVSCVPHRFTCCTLTKRLIGYIYRS